jgi:predicted nucleotide-binding protein
MARKPPPARQPKSLSLSAKREAVPRLEARVTEINTLDTSKLNAGDDHTVQALEGRIRSTLADIYGEDSSEYARLEQACQLDATAYVLHLYGQSSGPHVGEIRQGVERGKQRSIALLQGEIDALKEGISFATPVAIAPTPASSPASKEIFVVHGRDSPAKIEVARLIQKAGLKDVILHEQPNQGRTIIEKFEAHGGAAGFAVVVATADDVGGLDQDHLEPRARQNVIGEMFWFAGRLGRDRVCVLVKGKIEMPSDFAGIGYTDMDDRGAWKAELLRELQAAGYKNLDWASALA